MIGTSIMRHTSSALTLLVFAVLPFAVSGCALLERTGLTVRDEAAAAPGVEVIEAELRSAPVVSNGLTAGAPSEYNLVLRRPDVAPELALDPQVSGLTIPPGGRLEIEHLSGFARASQAIAANANVILTTGPQNPIVATAGAGPQHGDWALEDDGALTLAIIPRGAAGLSGERARAIGVKVVHVRPNPRSGAGPAVFTNGSLGTTLAVAVRLRDAEGRVIAEGRAEALVSAPDRPMVFVSNVRLQTRAQGRPDTVANLVESVDFQRVSPGARLDGVAPQSANPAPTFVLFAPASAQPDPFTPQRGLDRVGVRIDADDPHHGLLVQDNGDGVLTEADPVVGRVDIAGPQGARPRLLPHPTLTQAGDGTRAPNGAQLLVPVQLGRIPGDYILTIVLDGGNRAQITAIVE